MNKELTDMVLGLIRHAMTTAGGALVTNGVITQDDLTSIVGGALALLGIALSVWNKRKNKV